MITASTIINSAASDLGVMLVFLGVCSFIISCVFGVEPRLPHSPPVCPVFNPLLLAGTCSALSSDPAALLTEGVFLKLGEADCELANPCNYPPHYSPSDWEEFDFIVVGAGSAGSVVASRLSEIAGWSVLLIEAGGDPPKTSEVPFLCGALYNTEYDWKYKTESEEPTCLGLKGSQCQYTQGKMLGGSSSINGMLYVRGNPRDYDAWEAEGNFGWGYRDVLTYFKKSEDLRSPRVKCTPDYQLYHGTGGPLTVEEFNTEHYEPLRPILAQGLAELGYPFNPDHNGRHQSGFVVHYGTLQDGRRCSAAKAFLSKAKNRPNLKVSKFSQVTRILIDEITKATYGVEFIDRTGKTVRALARKEVILSAGAIRSPQLLMLSGIGPRDQLQQFEIQIVSDLPVGKNFQDQPVNIGFAISFDLYIPEFDFINEMGTFLLKGSSSMSLPPLTAFYNLFMESDQNGIDYPDIQVYFSYIPKNNPLPILGLQGFGFVDEIIQQYKVLNEQSSLMILSVVPIAPRSRGVIQLASKDPLQPPKIFTGYYSDPRDVDTMEKAIKFLRRLPLTSPFRALGAKFHEIKVKNCERFPFDSKPYRECFLRHIGIQGYHFGGTCRMGPSGHPDAVVDPELRVHGVDRLRVIDASVMPQVVRGNPNAATIMIGEKGADMVKHRWLSTPYTPPEGFKQTTPQWTYR